MFVLLNYTIVDKSSEAINACINCAIVFFKQTQPHDVIRNVTYLIDGNVLEVHLTFDKSHYVEFFIHNSINLSVFDEHISCKLLSEMKKNPDRKFHATEYHVVGNFIRVRLYYVD